MYGILAGKAAALACPRLVIRGSEADRAFRCANGSSKGARTAEFFALAATWRLAAGLRATFWDTVLLFHAIVHDYGGALAVGDALIDLVE